MRITLDLYKQVRCHGDWMASRNVSGGDQCGDEDGRVHIVPLPIQYGAELRRMLPSGAEDCKNKTSVWKALFDGFDRIEGVPSDIDRKVCVLCEYVCVVYVSVQVCGVIMCV